MIERSCHGAAVREIDARPLLVAAERPHRRDGLRCAERQIDPARTTPVRPRTTNELATPRMATLHQRHQLLGAYCLPGPQPQSLACLVQHVPDARRLRRLTLPREVVIATSRRDRTRLQIRAIARRIPSTDTRSRHHQTPNPTTRNCHALAQCI